MQTLHPRVRLLWALGAVVGAAVVGAVGAAGVLLLDLPTWVPVAAAGVVLAVGVAFALLRYRYWRYEVRADDLFLERGVLVRTRTVVPFVRVQHVDSSRGPVERALGLANVVVYTAGSRGADVTIPGLAPETADALHDRLRELAVESEPDDGV